MVKLNVRLFKQTEGFCGPSSVRMILDYYGIKRTENEVAKLMRATRKYGSTPKKIIAGTKRLGFSTYYKKSSSIKEIKSLLEKKTPVIIYMTRHKDGHYSVLFGIENNTFLIADPSMKRKLRLNLAGFLKIWKDPESEDEREIIVIQRN